VSQITKQAMGLKMKLNGKQRLFTSAKSGALLVLTLTPMTAMSAQVGADGQTENNQVTQFSETTEKAQVAVSNVPPIPQTDKPAITMASATTQSQTSSLDTGSELNTPTTDTETSIGTSTQANTESATLATEGSSPSTQSDTVSPQTQNETNTTPKVTGQAELLVPNGTAIQSQLLPLGQGSENPWASYATVGFLILGMAATGLLVVKLRQGKSFGTGKTERQMQVISSLALSPKRQILLVKIRDKEVALASTETGITLLTEIETPFRSAPHLIEDGGSEEPRRKKVQQKQIKEEPSRMIAASTEASIDESAMARSEMLMGALKNLREKSMRGKNATTNENNEKALNDSRPTLRKNDENSDPIGYLKSGNKSEPTLRQTRAAFPKYLANAFEKEANRPSSQQPTDEAGNVTNMIRERLKELRPLA